MKTKKYFIVPILALLAAGCQDDMDGEKTAQLATGEEVKFGATLGESTTTRTIYGDYDEVNKEYPIYWVDGDTVIVTSPDCADNGGVGSATYRVSVAKTQDYADNLTKTGDIGVRWGENSTGTFYSVYPASGAEFATNLTTVTLDMPHLQFCDVDDNNNVNPDMDACFMYAKTENVNAGETVNLKYIPISTAIRFTLRGPSTVNNEVMVQSIYFNAPDNTPISGKFTVNLNNVDLDNDNDGQADQVPTLSGVNGQCYNYVEINAVYESSRYLTLTAEDEVEMNIFFLLEGETEVDDDWSIVIRTTNGTTYTKKLALNSGNTLVPGKVHDLGKLPNLDNDADWDAANWMKYLPRNVYLSEISIPGSWNSVNSSSQSSSTDIETQYNAGARAFHIDTRWKGQYNLTTLYRYRVDYLGVANGGDSRDGGSGRIMTSNDNPSFSSVLNTITKCVKEDEYMVVYCTFAQDSYDYQDTGGWESAISSACANNTAVIDARDLNENSVVADVLGKVIVIINTDETVSDLGLSGSKCLFMTGMGMELDQSTYTGKDYTETTLAYGSGSDCVDALGTHAQVTANGNSGYDTGDRGYAPSLTERETKAGSILTYSQEHHQAAEYAHDTWLYLGLGGYIADEEGEEYDNNAHSTVASELNNWIDGKIEDMEKTSYYPVGIVLMNNVTSYSDVMVNILKLNNTYAKASDENRSPTTGDPINGTTTTSVSSAVTGYNSGMKDNNTNAISWD